MSITTQHKASNQTDKQEQLACNLCGSSESTLVLRSNTQGTYMGAQAYACTSPHVGQHGTIVRCARCGLVYTSPRPTPEEIDTLYSQVEDSVYLEEEAARVATFRHSLLGVRRHEPGGKLLDVGCHVGTFMSVAKSAGYEVEGVEPSEWAARVARNRGLRVHTGGLGVSELVPEGYDVITVWDVIEHFSDPFGELVRMRELLVPGGLLVLSTMNVGSVLPRVLGGRWPWYMLMHLYYFTPQTMSAMLERAGYEVLEITPHVRVVHVRYLVSKLGAYNVRLQRLVGGVTERLGLGGVRLPVYLGDLMTVYARKR